jgi:hypothetical protein
MPPKSSKGPPSRRSFLITKEHNILTMTAGQAQVTIAVRRKTHVSNETLLSRIGTLVTGMFASVKMVVVGVSDQHETGDNQGYSEIKEVKQAACFMLMSEACEIAYIPRTRSCKIMSTSISIPGTLYQGIKTLPLEVITYKPLSSPRPTPLLFVHGAWCWIELSIILKETKRSLS